MEENTAPVKDVVASEYRLEKPETWKEGVEMVCRRDDSGQLTWDLEEVLDKFFGTGDAMEVILQRLQLLWQGSAKLLTL